MSKPLRALLLAAGLGTRLRPLTLTTPKCLVPLAGEPLLGHWLRKLEAVGCESVLVNTHHLAEQVLAFIEGWHSSTLQVFTVHEPELLGTAGTLLVNQDFFAESTGLLIHADNAMAAPLDGLLAAHAERPPDCLLTMLTFTTSDPQSCGIVEISEGGRVIAFHEKVNHPPGDRANAALYAFDASLLNHLSLMEPPPSDFSLGVIPDLIPRIHTWHTKAHYFDVGTPAALDRAQNLWLSSGR